MKKIEKIVSAQLGYKASICANESIAYFSAHQTELGSSYLWHHDGHFERYKLMILLTEADIDSCLKVDKGSNETRFDTSYLGSRFHNYLPKNQINFSGKPGDAFLFDTSLIHQAGNCRKGQERLVFIAAFGDTHEYMSIP